MCQFKVALKEDGPQIWSHEAEKYLDHEIMAEVVMVAVDEFQRLRGCC